MTKNGPSVGRRPCTRRINERLDAMRAVREQATQQTMLSTGRALVLVTKREITIERFNQYARERGIRLGRARSSRYHQVEGAAAAGRAAGDRVGFSSGNIGGAGVTAIGGGH